MIKSKCKIWVRQVCFGFALVCGIGNPVAESADLYMGEAPVSGEDAQERNRAILAAFDQVLVKLTGSRSVATRTGYQELLAKAPLLVQQYRYRMDEAQDDGVAQRFLTVRFDPPAVDRMLAERAWSIWREPRPRLLVWLVKDEGGQRNMVSADLSPDIRSALRQQAQARGVELQLPLLDLEDQSQLTAADAWSGFEPRIMAASQRYGGGPILVGRLKFLGGERWQPDWTLYDAARTQAFAAAPGGLTDVMREAVDMAADFLAVAYAPSVAVTGPAPVRVTVTGVYALGDYAKVLGIMGNAPGINRLSVRRPAGDLIVFDIWLDGDATDLSQGLGQYPELRADTVMSTLTGVQQLAYRWEP